MHVYFPTVMFSIMITEHLLHARLSLPGARTMYMKKTVKVPALKELRVRRVRPTVDK